MRGLPPTELPPESDIAEPLPGPSEYNVGNADSCFFGEHAIGVADGVSGVSKHGIDPALLSNELMRTTHEACNQYHDKPEVFEKQMGSIYNAQDLPNWFCFFFVF